MERCQEAIKAAITNKPTPIIRGVQKLPSKDIRFRYDMEEEAQQLRQIDWTKAYTGLTIRKPKYGIVIHGIPSEEIDPSDNMEYQAKEIEHQNEDKQLKIINLRTIKQTDKLNPAARHNSFIIQTHDTEAADKCLKKGVYINYRLYPTEKHTPQYQITQCYKCQ